MVSSTPENLPSGSHLITTEALETSSSDPHIPHAQVEWSFWDLEEFLESHEYILGRKKVEDIERNEALEEQIMQK